ncbi:group 10 secretory phospholipase A2 isoform X2 [Takifugu rubripes]|uniref:group 10 secretory phospholipase A2 isoform X2 n=1 Tax=Takifugu rubripes TaxID=31033 RepID=UPI000298FFE7|nr:phospholipase A2-like isoform X2 [Takifugu rubripes]|eukprot:XP_003964900.1 PREDICTED: group 10 secretory phospholipase A2-like [Takifugu rubripes]
MTALHRILLLLSVTAASTGQRRAARSKRGLLELAGAIKCSTGRSALAYMMYGCYCGLGGQGWPRDRADWCCHRHDCCYGDAERFGCHTKTDQYRWKCEEKTVACDDLKDKCEKLLCKCDMEAARCLRRAPFSQKYAMWPDFLCGYKQPTCNIYSLNVPLCK